MDLVVKENLVLRERRISLSEFHAANEVRYFMSWTFVHLVLLLRFFALQLYNILYTEMCTYLLN